MHTSSVIFGFSPLWLSTILLLLVYGALIADTLNRAIVAMLGASAMVITGVLTQDQATASADPNTIGLLTGMMILVSISRRSGLFQYLAIWSARHAKASPWGILLILQITTAVLSALLDNVTTVLLVVPVTLAITRALDVPAYPFLFAEVFASNIGGTATLIGDPPNILIGSLADLSFNAFVFNLTPVIIVVMAVQAVIIHWIWGHEMHATPESRARIMAMVPEDAIEDSVLLKQSLVILGTVIIGFIFARQIGLEPGTIAMVGATILMLIDNWEHHGEKQAENVHKTFTDVEWITIFFFIGLFIIVHGVEVGGLLKILAEKLVAATGGDMAHAGYAILWASAFLSAIIDNIPFVATMIPLVKSMAPALGGPEAIEPLWWCLSLGACLGGNGTLIGASANLTVAGIAEREGINFSFWTYTKLAFPLMLVSVAISHGYVWMRYF